MADGTSNRIGFDIVVDTKASDNNITTLKQDINNLQSAIEKVSKDSSINVSVDGTKKSFQELMTILDNTKNKFNQLMAQTEENQEKTAQAVQKTNLAIQKQQEKAYNDYIQDLQKKSDAHSKYIDKQTQAADSLYNKSIYARERNLNEEQSIRNKLSNLQQKESEDKIKRQQQESEKISNIKAEQSRLADSQYYKDQENTSKSFSNQLKMQMQQREDISKQIGSQNKSSGIQQYKDLEKSSKNFANQLKAQMQQEVSNENERYRVLNEELSIRSKLAKIQEKEAENNLKQSQKQQENQNNLQQKVGSNYFSQAKSGLQSEWMNNYYDYSKGNIGAREYAQNVSKIKLSAQELTKEINKMGVAFDNSTERGISFSNKLKSHLYWITAGTLLGAVTAIPYEVFTTLEKLDTGMAGMNQVIDHTAIATTAAKTGISEQTVAQSVLNNEQNKFIGIASTYGETIDKVIDSGKLWARTYKDIDTVNALVSQSTKLAVADNFSMAEANKYVEAAMFQYGLTAKNTSEAMAYSGNVIDVWTKLAHNAGASAQDIAKGVEQAGSAAHIAGADFEFLSAQIATGVRATGRSGNEIGKLCAA